METKENISCLDDLSSNQIKQLKIEIGLLIENNKKNIDLFSKILIANILLILIIPNNIMLSFAIASICMICWIWSRKMAATKLSKKLDQYIIFKQKERKIGFNPRKDDDDENSI